jgi:hypothetical protein
MSGPFPDSTKDAMVYPEPNSGWLKIAFLFILVAYKSDH